MQHNLSLSIPLILGMSCSSRISRIVPTALPLTWEGIPADLQPLPTPLYPSSDALLMQHGDIGGKRKPAVTDKGRLPGSPMPGIPLILSPRSPRNVMSRKSPQSHCPPPITKHRGNPSQPNQTRSEDVYNAISKSSTQKQDQVSGLWSPGGHHAPSDALPRVNSSPAFTTSPDKTRWMMVATNVHRRHSRQNESDNAKTHSRKYSHIVRTDALTPNPSVHAERESSSQTPTYQRQPWLTGDNDIDWAAYFKTQPLPMSATWSRKESTLHHVDGTWTQAARIISP